MVVTAILGISWLVHESEEGIFFLHTSGPTDELSEGGKKMSVMVYWISQDTVCMIPHLTSANSDDVCSSNRM